MSYIHVDNLSLHFPIIGADSQSLKRHLKQVAIGGLLAKKSQNSSRPILVALRDVTFDLRAGDRLGLIGANGSGKTTLLRCLAGAYTPDRGVVEVEGRVASLLDLSIGIDASATGFENIRLRGLVAGLNSREIEAKADEIATFSGLGPFLAMPMKSYSSGMVNNASILVLASHDQNLIRSLCNKVMRLDHGIASEVVPVAEMDDLMARPTPERKP